MPKNEPTKPSFEDRILEARSPAEAYEIIWAADGKKGDLLHDVAKCARVWDEGLITWVVSDDRAVFQFLNNEHRPEGSDLRVARWWLKRMGAEQAKDELQTAEAILKRVARGGMLPLDGAEMQWVYDLLLEGRDRPKLTRRRETAFNVLMEHPEMSAERLAEMAERLPRLDAQNRLAMATHPSATQPVWRMILREVLAEDPMAGAWVDAVIRHHGIRNDPEFRTHWVEGAYHVGLNRLFGALIADANPNDCAALFRQQANLNALAAANLLREHGEKVSSLLSQQDVMPLLQSINPQIRLAAIAATGQTPPAPKERGAVRR